MKTEKTIISVQQTILTAVLAYGVALSLCSQLNKAGVPAPAWIFHLYGAVMILSKIISRVLYQKAGNLCENKPLITAHSIFSRISIAMTAIWVGLVFPGEASFIISKMFYNNGEDGQLKFVLIATIIIGVICFCLYQFVISKMLGQIKTLKKFMRVLKNPELCTEESDLLFEKYSEEFPTESMKEYSKLLRCSLYEKSNRPELALQLHETVSPSALDSSVMPVSFFYCDRLYYYLINGKVDEASRFFSSYYNELNQLYREKHHPAVLHTFAMFYRSTGDIATARKFINEALEKKLPEKSMVFAVTAENAACCLAEGNLGAASEAIRQARTLAEFPNEKALLSRLEQTVGI